MRIVQVSNAVLLFIACFINFASVVQGEEEGGRRLLRGRDRLYSVHRVTDCTRTHIFGEFRGN